MAHITLQLMWYRLTEAGSNMAEALDDFVDWYREFRLADMDIVDMLLFGWILFGAFVFFTVKIIRRYSRPPDELKNRHQTSEHGQPVVPVRHIKVGSGFQWVNSVINWLYLHYDNTPDFITNWIEELNHQCKKHVDTNNYLVQFDQLNAGSLPPKVTEVHTEAGPRDSLVITATIDSRELGFLVTISSNDIKSTACDVSVIKLQGELTVLVVTGNDGLQVSAKFEKRPGVQVIVKPQKESDIVLDVTKLGEVIRDAISNASVTFNLVPRPGLRNHTIIADSLQKVVNESLLQGAPPKKPPRTQDKRVLVKVIKASGLGAKGHGCTDPYCIVFSDEPPQRHVTSVVRNTVNPLWDEHFLFDVNADTNEIKIEVYDREKAPGENFLGQVVYEIQELQQSNDSRLIMPLKGRQSQNNEGGNITVEFLFMEPASSQQGETPVTTSTDDQISPRRRIETSRHIMPSGTVVMETKTITEKPLDQRLDAFVNESPQKIVKTDSSSNFAKYPINQDPELVMVNGGESVTDIAIQHVLNRSQSKMPTKTSTVVITSVHRASDGIQIPTITTTDMSPDSDVRIDESINSSRSSTLERSDKKRSLGSKIKKGFSNLRRQRSKSMERPPSSIPDDKLLQPPGGASHTLPSDSDVDTPHSSQQGSPQVKPRSRLGLGGSFKKLFRGKKKKQTTSKGDISGPSSRESSISRASEQMQAVSKISPEKDTHRHSTSTNPPAVQSGGSNTPIDVNTFNVSTVNGDELQELVMVDEIKPMSSEQLVSVSEVMVFNGDHR